MKKPFIDFRTINFGRSPMALAAIVLLALFGSASIAYGLSSENPRAIISQPGSVKNDVPPLPTSEGKLDRTEPAQIKLPSLKIESNIIQVGRNADGTVEVPDGEHHEKVGWYKYSSTPGKVGPSVFLGHYDSKTGPSIFYNLVDLKEGDPIVVTRADGSEVQFITTSVKLYPKNQFPTQLVYGHTNDEQIRLITCGGEYDQAAKDYKDNVVALGKLVQ